MVSPRSARLLVATARAISAWQTRPVSNEPCRIAFIFSSLVSQNIRVRSFQSLPLFFGDEVSVREERVVVGRNDDEGRGAAHRGRYEDVTLNCIVANGRVDQDEARADPGSRREPPTVLLLHGFPDSWYTWRHQIPALARAGYRVVCPDMRGYGRSSKPSLGGIADFGAEALVGDVVALRRHFCGEGSRFALLCGHDWGAAVAWTVASVAPDVAERVVVVNVPHPASFAAGFLRPSQMVKSWYMFVFQVPYVPESMVAAFDGALVRWAMRKRAELTGGIDGTEEESVITDSVTQPRAMECAIHYYRAAAAGLWPGFVPRAVPLWAVALTRSVHDLFYPPISNGTPLKSSKTEDGFENWKVALRAAMRRDVSENQDGNLIPPVKAPTLIIWGKNDKYLSKDMAVPPLDAVPLLMPNAPVFLNASHWPHWDVPERVNSEILALLNVD